MGNAQLEELLKYLNLLVLPSTLWAVHIDPKYDFIVVLHIGLQSLKIHVDKAILVSGNPSSGSLDTSLFIENEIVKFSSFNDDVKSISDLAHIVYFMHNLKQCSNSIDSDKYPECLKYIDVSNLENKLCNSCSIQNDINWKNVEVQSLDCSANLNREFKDDLRFSIIKNDDLLNVAQVVNSFLTNDLEISQLGCKFCEKSFNDEISLQEHLQVHSKQEQIVCNICNETSATKAIHEKHLLIHSESKSNLCNVCGKTFRSGYRMQNHLLTHSSEKPFKCDTCSKCFAKNYNLQLHKKTHSGAHQFVCFDCGKSYTTQSNLATHMKGSHSNKKPYNCNNCDMSFVHPRYLRIHMRKHTGEKPYKCKICFKVFSKNIHLTVHMRTHTGEKPHVCSFCGKGFTTTGNLNSHKRVHHKDVKESEENCFMPT